MDVYASGFTGGTAKITVSYTDAEVAAAGLDENTLNLYIWYEGAWHLGNNPGRDTVANKVWGTFDVTKLSGAPGGIGGNPLAPVGGYLAPVNKLTILAPYFAFVALVGAVSTVFVIRRGRKA